MGNAPRWWQLPDDWLSCFDLGLTDVKTKNGESMATDVTGRPGDDTQVNAAPLIIFGVFLLSLGYAVLRYHILGPVPWKDFPLYILNKGVCLAAFLLLTLNFSLGPYKSLGVQWLSLGLMPAKR